MILIATVVIGLYFWGLFADSTTFISGLSVGFSAVTCAGVALLVAVISYLSAPKEHVFEISLVNYALLIILSAALIIDTGQIHSPFIALWMIIAVFSGVFGVWGIGPFAILIAAYAVGLYIQHALDISALVTLLFAGAFPLAISYLIWHTDGPAKDKGDQAYRALATELSQVAGKSEVVINAIADGVIAVDAGGVIELINPAAQQIIGWGKQDALKLDYRSVLKLVDKKNNELDETNDPVAQVLATNKQVTNNDLTLVTNSGKNILVSLLISPVGQIGSGAIIVFRDITREKAEERQQAEFISTASHEMRTPVASIEGYLGLALNPATAQIDQKARDFIMKAHESAEHLGRLFQDLLDVSKADDSRLQNNPKVINLVEFIHDIVEGLRPKAEEKGLRLTFKPKPDDDSPEGGDRVLSPIYYVNVDPDHLREVVANLVENGIKYTPRGDVIVDISGDQENVEISVADSGIGIPPEDVGHLFQKFYRVDNSETREIGGTGLGLYLCRRLTETMNGRIWVESRYKEGSTFFVSLPRLANDEATRMIESAGNTARTMIGHAQAIATEDHPAIEQPTLSPVQPQAVPAEIPQPQPQTFQPAAQSPAPQQSSIQAQQPSVPQQAISRPAPFTTTSSMPAIEKRPLGTPPTSQTAPPRANIPLSAIEQNKAAYLTPRPNSVSIPERQSPEQKP